MEGGTEVIRLDGAGSDWTTLDFSGPPETTPDLRGLEATELLACTAKKGEGRPARLLYGSKEECPNRQDVVWYPYSPSFRTELRS